MDVRTYLGVYHLVFHVCDARERTHYQRCFHGMSVSSVGQNHPL